MKLSTFQKGLLLVLIFFLLAGGILFVTRILMGDSFNKEEAQHAINALWIARDLRSLDLGAFWYDTQRQLYWPFLHSWLLSIFFLVLGASYLTARFFSLFLLLATVILMYLISSRLSKNFGWKIGVLSAFLALTSPMVIKYSTLNTLESLGALIFLGSYYFYMLSEECSPLTNYVVLAILVGLSIYTSYLYAYLIIPAFIVVALGKLGPVVYDVANLARRGEKAALPFLWWAYRKLIFLTVLLLVVASWFLTSSFSRKIMLFMQEIFKYSGGATPASVTDAILYYPRAIIGQYTFSPWLGILMVVTLFLPIVAFHDEYRPINKLFTFIWTVLVLLTLTVPTKAPQFIYVIAPFLFLVFAVVVFYLAEKLPKLSIWVFLIIFLPAVISLPSLAGVYFPARPAENMLSVLNFFKQTSEPGTAIGSAIDMQHYNPEVVEFHFADWQGPVLADPTAGQDEIFSGGQNFFALEIDDASPYRAELLDDSIFSWNAFLADKVKAGEVRELSQRRFGSIGLTARIFAKQAR